MDTSEVYVEPVLIGALMLVAFALPYSPEVQCLLHAVGELKLPEGVAIGAMLVGIAYITGILADRLIDSGLEALERHNRIRFALMQLTDPWPFRVHNRTWSDPYPEDRYRYCVMAHGEQINDFLGYVRSRVRLMRGLTFLLPAVLYGGTVGMLRLHCSTGSADISSGDDAWCKDVWGAFPLSSNGINPSRWWVWVMPIVVAYTAVWLMNLIARCIDRPSLIRIRHHPIFKHLTLLLRRGRWRPPRTDDPVEMRRYAAVRGWIAGRQSNRSLASDIILQPTTVILGALLLFTGTLASRVAGQPGPILAIAAGALAEFAAGWVWWRITGTFMSYLRGAGNFLDRREGMHASRLRQEGGRQDR